MIANIKHERQMTPPHILSATAVIQITNAGKLITRGAAHELYIRR